MRSSTSRALFKNRQDAARQLAVRLRKYKNLDPLILGIPRGGVEIGYYIARELETELSVLVTKKLPHPTQPEYGIGAVCEEGTVYLQPGLSVSPEILDPIVDGIKREITRRVEIYRKGHTLPLIKGRTVILADDGIATGITLAAAIRLCRKHEAEKVVVAVPFSGQSYVEEINTADELVLLHQADQFISVGQAYDDFSQLDDRDVMELLQKADFAKVTRRPASADQPQFYHPLATSTDLDALIERIGESKLVLLGEASHGTHEYYTWRSAISRRLIAEKGFNFIAVEGDWPDCYRINRYIKGYDDQEKSPEEVLRSFNRWPTWMWANWEIAALVSWLKTYNGQREKKVGFYGLDVYSLWESLEVLVDYLKTNDPATATIAEKALHCFSGYRKNEQQYARQALTRSCKEQVSLLLKEIRHRAISYNMDPEAALNTVQNAHIATGAERYYRSMMSFDDRSWNVRDRHMMETLNRVLQFHGPDTKAIIWQHNTHIGDARYTDMAGAGLFNLGQLVREQYGRDDCVLVGFSSYTGTVMAGDSWGAPMREMELPPAQPGSLEEELHNESTDNRYIIFNEPAAKERFDKIFQHRAVGVVYHPHHEQHNYVPTVLARRYDAMIYLDTTSALNALHVTPDPGQVPETYPFEV